MTEPNFNGALRVFTIIRMTGHIWSKGPLFAGVLVTLLLIYESYNGYQYLPTDKTIDYGNLYAAVFDWSAIQTGFLFAAFGYITGGSTKFIRFIEETSLMAAILNYVRRATYLGFVLTFASLPLLILTPKFTHSSFPIAVGLSIWFGLFVWSILAFLRVAYIFGLVAQRAGESEPLAEQNKRDAMQYLADVQRLEETIEDLTRRLKHALHKIDVLEDIITEKTNER